MPKSYPLSLAGSLISVGLFFAACQAPSPPPKDPVPVPAPAATAALDPALLQELTAAQTQLQQGDLPGVIHRLEALVERFPAAGRAWLLLGAARHQDEDFDGAVGALEKALDIDSSAPRAMYGLAKAYSRLEDPDKAWEWLSKARDSGKVNMTQILLDQDLLPLAEDARWNSLLPTDEEFQDPFVESARVLREWQGETPRDAFGWIARNIGDVDGDGAHDVTTSSPGASQRAGKIYTYSSRSGHLLWSQDGTAGAQLGTGIEAAGDVNADGIPDVVAGAPGIGKAFVYGGLDGVLLLTLEASQEGDGFGRSVADIGDFDGDGHDDLLVGSPLNDSAFEDAGRAAVYSGKDGSVLLEILGEGVGDQFGSSGAGSHREGKGLLVVGAPNAGGGQRGRTYVYRDGAAEPAFIIEAESSGAQLGGMFVSVVGDVDADGAPDVYASDWADGALGPQTGRIYIHSGRSGDRLFTLLGETAGDGFGIGPADAGDVDGDGHDDLIIGAWQQGLGAPSGGKTYLYSGKDGSLMREITCKVPGDTFGFDATGIGDIDGDGTLDLLLTSAWSAVNGARSGRMFLIAGEPE